MAKAQVARHPACATCGHPGSPDNPLTADHVLPRIAGGRSAPANLQTLCRRHNSAKGARLAAPKNGARNPYTSANGGEGPGRPAAS
jgi:5-methylcytosine-specific restriction endonuclease McrA